MVELALSTQKESKLVLGEEVMSIENKEDYSILKTNKSSYEAKYLVFCAGLQADRMAKKDGVKIKEINNEKLSAYANDLKGGIILSIGNIKAIDVETVSKALSNLDENQAVQIEMLTTNGQVIRLIL